MASSLKKTGVWRMGGTERGAGTARKEVKRECRVPGELGQFEGENVQFSRPLR